MARQAELCLKSIVDGTLSTSLATQQVRRAETVPTHLSHCRPGKKRCARVTTLAGSGPEEAYLNAQDPVVRLYYRMHEGTHLRFLQSGSIGAALCRVEGWFFPSSGDLGCLGDFYPRWRFHPKLPFAPSRRSYPSEWVSFQSEGSG